MSGKDQITYGGAARLRIALAHQAAKIAGEARSMVPTCTDNHAHGGEFVEAAARIADDARELLALAVTYERRRGTFWEVIGETLGISRQSAHERFAAAQKRMDAELTERWLADDDPWFTGLPEGATDPAETASRLDRWAVRHMQPADALAYKAAGDPERARPVSHNLPPMDTGEHSSMVMAGANLIRERPDTSGPDDERIAQLKLGLARRKVELYERMIAEETGERGRIGADVGDLAELLAAARAQLAELEGYEDGPAASRTRRP
ncbi:MAG TPA: hypothetical protein VE733_31190 [Streptosporangiaceae bacterium]|nr:hypothetical protein [Streptosporangiaceae bacterium]